MYQDSKAEVKYVISSLELQGKDGEIHNNNHLVEFLELLLNGILNNKYESSFQFRNKHSLNDTNFTSANVYRRSSIRHRWKGVFNREGVDICGIEY